MFSILFIAVLFIVFFLGGMVFYRKHQAKIEEAKKAVEDITDAI